MIITNATDIHGDQRVYLGGTGSLECWIEPTPDTTGWRFRMDDGLGGNCHAEETRRAFAIHQLARLAEALDVAPEDLAAVPFEMIQGLHTTNPRRKRRMATPGRSVAAECYMSHEPTITRPRAVFTRADYERTRHR